MMEVTQSGVSVNGEWVVTGDASLETVYVSGDISIDGNFVQTISYNSQTADYTLTATDVGKIVIVSSDAALTVALENVGSRSYGDSVAVLGQFSMVVVIREADGYVFIGGGLEWYDYYG